MTRTKIKKRYIITGGILLLFILFRLFLPYIVLRYANNTLSHMQGYYGHVQDIDIALYRGAYQLNNIYINKLDSATQKQTEFFRANTIDLSVEWHALFEGNIVGELELYDPKLVFTKDKAELGQVAKDTNDFRQVLKDFMPLKVNRFEVHNGSIHYVDSTAAPKVDISLQRTYILARNLKNTADKKELLPSTVKATADVYGGQLSLNMKLNALAKDPTFDLNAEMTHANLAQLNNFFKAYGKFDVSKGTMGLYSEFAAEQGDFKGYVKPIIKDLQVKGMEDKHDPFLQKAKETVIDAAAHVLRNPRKKQVASKIKVEGSFHHSSTDIMGAVWEVLKNAFIEALLPSVDNEINIGSVAGVEQDEKKGFFKRLFGGKDDDKDKKDDKDSKKEDAQVGLEKYKTSHH
ncbi:MAG TPA: DUF748 domain-containing protein [Chitinophaga sp.]|uniref:DUF748 domain-containing protein n=1 Tax=Chitinophaga sp. TaxID=1869181 RepID=UPI002DBF3359|nr:DUF748 domain-containing protein [Chitinophaga sp.]HEU4553727.1 DUF748 domain-containing protein [Chitinophaga sp.]